MRLRTLSKLLVVGLAARAVVRYQRSRRLAARRGAPWDLARDPRDAVQGFDEVVELQVEPLDVDALSNEDIEAAQDLAGLESDVDQIAQDDDVSIERFPVDASDPRDAAELYGSHLAMAVDRVLPDEDQAAAEGQTWFEALETSAIESGALPARTLDDLLEDDDLAHPLHAPERGDRPVADYGSGGRRGL